MNELGGSSTVNNMMQYLAVGTDSTAPAAGDTGLIAETGVRTNDNGGFSDVVGFGASNEYAYVQRVRLFEEAESNGNLTEVGLFKNSSGSPMWMRQLFKDGGGTPTTIVKTASDQLRVTYEFRVYPPASDVTGTISISGVNFDYTGRAANVDDASAWGSTGILLLMGGWNTSARARVYETQTLGTDEAEPAGTSHAASSISYSVYSAGNFYRDCTHIWEPSAGNPALGVGTSAFGFVAATANPAFQTAWERTSDGTRIDKDNTKRLTLVTRVSWANH